MIQNCLKKLMMTSLLMAAVQVNAQPCEQLLQISSPFQGSDANFLMGVTALTANDAWAVGHYRSGSTQLPLSIHWDGMTWSVRSMPTPASSGGVPQVMLYDVHAFGPEDIWAVGSNPPASTGSSAVESLVYRWNGTTWSIVPSPIGCCGSFGSQFYCVDGVSANDFWAVGYKANPVAASPLAAHWNGSSWNEMMLPASTGSINSLKDLHVISNNDIWALEASGLSQPNAPRRIFHWDGSSWSTGAPSINAVQYAAAEAIFAFSPNDIWVSSVRASGGQIVMLHFNGSSWTEMNVPVFAYEFFGNAPNDLYAVGNASIMHWDGSAWSVIASLPGMTLGNFFDAQLAPDGTLWCAGNTQPGPESATLTARYSFCSQTSPGDIDADGDIDTTDLQLFIAVVLGMNTTPEFVTRSDLNSDGARNGLDAMPFVSAMTGG